MDGTAHKAWHAAEFERIAQALGRRGARSVQPAGSFADGTHDVLSDLDLTVVGLDPRDEQAVLDLFDEGDVLGRERYTGAHRALHRVLLRDGRQYDIKVLRSERDAQADAPKASAPGTDEFWFALHAAHHALARGRTVVALDLVLASYRAVTHGYWSAPDGVQSEIRTGLQALDLQMTPASIERAILLAGRLAGLAFDDPGRSRAFASVVEERSEPSQGES
ncbi:hypothetical protein [Rubrivirga sp. IMCC45206]|uniref:hypothetical protein n=1 Tax=Rubrivirga sp. IMCC45206 TaxID=3391614 RepID=UPI00398FD0FB